jgi:radical SAM superfamily enzyme YgiQ (UPF0313 family)
MGTSERPSPRDVLLIHPPGYYPWCVPPGLGYLSGFLENHGFTATILDANALALEHLLARHSSDPSHTRAMFRLLRDLAAAQDWQCYEDAMSHLNLVARNASAALGEALVFTRNTLRYRSRFDPRSAEQVLRAAGHPELHLFGSYYSEEFLPAVRRSRPMLIGFSASDLYQLLPATVMVSVLRREMGAECPPIVFGGNVFSRIAHALAVPNAVNAELLRLWGHVVVGEGERPLLDLAQALERGEVDFTPEGTVTFGRMPSRRSLPIALDELAAPSVKGVVPLAPRMAIPLNIYRGCFYAGICEFCDINHGYDTIRDAGTPRLAPSARRIRSLDLVIQDITSLTGRHKSSLISFTDEWFRAREMKLLAERLIAEGVRVQWEAYARLEPAFTDPALATLLARSGARFFQFGLESAADSTLKSVQKGTSAGLAARVLETLARAGIWNHVFVIVGLPGERLHDTLLTVAFLGKHANSIFSIKPTRFRLSRHSPYATGGGKEGIQPGMLRGDRDLALNLPFSYAPLPTCRRCRRVVHVQTGERACPVCRDHLWFRPVLSHRAVNAMYTVLDLLVARHWAYPFTSLYPYGVRLLFSPAEAARIAAERSESVDRNLGLGSEQVDDALRVLRGYLRQEHNCFEDIQARYEMLRLEDTPSFETVEDVAAFAKAWVSVSGGKPADPPHMPVLAEAGT